MQALPCRSNAASHDCLLDVTSSGGYAATYEPLENYDRPARASPPNDDGDDVTIGIGVLCRNAETAVIASDMRTVFPKSNIQPHDWTGKQWDFDVPFPVAACVAGTLGMCQPVVDELNNQLRKLVEKDEHLYCEHIENAMLYARTRTWRRYVDWCIRMGYGGMTLREWHRGKVPHGKMHKIIHDEVRKFIDNLEFKVEFVLAGFLPDGHILFYKASAKKPIEASSTPGVYVIGSGGQLAMDQLAKRSQSAECGLPRTLLHVAEALEEARKVKDKSVGKPMGLTILWNDGRMRRINPNASIFRDWMTAYSNRADTSSLDGNPNAQAQLDACLQQHVPRR